jgi:hypothetical protein
MNMRNVALLLALLLLSSCAGLYRFAIEVQEPAPITLPPHVVDLGIVNHAAPQPGDQGITRTYRGKRIEQPPLALDSVAALTTLSLAASLQESAFFHRLWVSPASLRTDNNWMSVEPLPVAVRTELFGTRRFNALLTLDRLLFKLDQEIRNNLYTHLSLSAIATCTLYLDDRETPLTTFSFSDSLSLSLPIAGDTLDLLKYLPESVIEDFAHTIGEQLSRRIIPTWTEQERRLYAGSNARMSEALSFARKGNWRRAATLWTHLYEHATSASAKAKVAANLAVACEMQDRFPDALQWAATAQAHFRETSAAATPVDTYIDELQKRIRNNHLLDLQWGVPTGE